MLVQRALVTFTLGPLVLGLIYLGGWFLTIPVIAIMLIASTELQRMFAPLNANIPLALVMPAIVAHLLVAQLAPADQKQVMLMAVFFLSIFFALLVSLRSYEKSVPHASLAFFGTVTTIFLLGWLASHAILLRNGEPARGSAYWQWTTIVILSTWLSDMGAYLVGSFVAGRGIFGRHLLTPRLSPKKTIEGYVGGVIIGAATGCIVGILVFSLPSLTVVLLCTLVAAIGTAGDLAISLFKRESGVKDSGNLFPGHGGALDRIDSLLWAVAFGYYFLFFF